MLRIDIVFFTRKLIALLITETVVLLIVSACSKVENKQELSELIISASPSFVEYMGNVHLSWRSTCISECKLNGNSVETKGMLDIKGILKDTSFTLTGKGLSGELFSKTADIKVGARTKYYDYLDTLCSGRWVLMQKRTLGIPIWNTKPDEWYIQNMNDVGDWSDGVNINENPYSKIFSKDVYYNTLIYKSYDTYYLEDDPHDFELSRDFKSIKFGGYPPDPGEDIYLEIKSFNNDSLVLYQRNAFHVWAGSFGSGNGNFPTYTKYIHYKDLDKKIDSNDTTSLYFKLLTSGPWKLEKIKFYFDNVYKYDESLSEVIKNMKYYFFKTGVFAGYENDVIREGPNKWYLIENNTKILRAGFCPSYILNIIKLDPNFLTVSRNGSFTDLEGILHTNKEEFYYIK